MSKTEHIHISTRCLRYLREHNPLPVIGFLIPIAHLIAVRGLSRGILFMFVLPALFATALIQKTENASAIIASYVFLFLITIGVVLGKLPNVFPNLGGRFSDLPPQHDRSLSWYLLCYLAFGFSVAPVIWFADNLRRHRQGKTTELAKFTCWLGLAAELIFTPMVAILAVTEMGLWPIF